MKLGHKEIRERYKSFWKNRPGHPHKEVPPASLALTGGDSTTLFTSSGMQQLVPYLLGEVHPLGKELFDVQPCIRTQDIEEVGDNRHTTAFEMLGNWSLGTYFKKEQLPWFFEFLTDKKIGLGLDALKIYVSVFAGHGDIPKDDEAISIWKEIFKKVGIDAEEGNYSNQETDFSKKRIFGYDAKKNWWSRAGTPETMPVGEPGGPSSEVFFDFGADLKIHENSKFKDQACHLNCDCGRFVEIGNNVFMTYKKVGENKFEELPQKNIDFGGGLERLAAAVNDDPDVFKTDIFHVITLKIIDTATNNRITDPSDKNVTYDRYLPLHDYLAEDIRQKTKKRELESIRIIADHLKASTFLIKEGVRPSNKEQGYILRRLLRRAAVKMHQLTNQTSPSSSFVEIAKEVIKTYENIYFKPDDIQVIEPIIRDEMERFYKSLAVGLKEIKKREHIDGKGAFDIYQSYGFPLELIEELAREKGHEINKEEFYAEFNKHKELSRTASAGMFKGGLADHSDQVLKYHTATHLLHQALFDVLGNDVRQEGSNITSERLRFDFYSMKKPTDDEMEKVSEIINQKISEGLSMRFKLLPKLEAETIGARSFFKEKYPDTVKVYYIGGEDEKPETAYSKEFCGGPHVKNTKEIGKIEIFKFEKIGSNMYRVYAK